MKPATLPQGNYVSNMIVEKGVPLERLQALITGGYLSDLFDAPDPSKIDRKTLRKLLGIDAADPAVQTRTEVITLADYTLPQTVYILGGEIQKRVVHLGNIVVHPRDVGTMIEEDRLFPARGVDPNINSGLFVVHESEVRPTPLSLVILVEGRRLSLDEVREEIKGLGLRNGSIVEQLAIAKFFPNLQRVLTIVALGSMKQPHGRGLEMPTLDANAGEREFKLCECPTRFSHHFAFVARA
ncbi:MAG: hypothetical protein HY461_02705 [Parcubacteria group bacterium]|nr:hypothetical protein [Parcubacteria group bacterium]